MTRLPMLEAELRRAAAGRARQTRRVGRGTVIALVTITSLLVASIAAAATGLISVGAPAPSEVPSDAMHQGTLSPGTARVLAVRAPDPAGGPPWGLRIYATSRGLTCVQAARVVNGELGTIGTDGVLHPLPPEGGPCQSGSSLAGFSGKLPMVSDGRPQGLSCDTPERASGSRPPCDPATLRTVLFGFVAGDGSTASISIDGATMQQQLSAADGRAYLFVLSGSPDIGPQGEAHGVVVH